MAAKPKAETSLSSLVVQDGCLTLRINAERTQAVLALASDHGEDPTRLHERVHAMLHGQNVVHGIDDSAIARLLEENGAVGELEIARATPARNGNPRLEEKFIRSVLPPLASSEEEKSPSRETVQLLRAQSPIVSLRYGSSVRPGCNILGQPLPPSAGLTLNAGENTVLSADASSVVARTSGYPRLDRQQVADGFLVTVTMEPAVQIAPDGMTATLTLRPPPPGQPLPDEALMRDLLAEAGVVHGLDSEAMGSISSYFASEGQETRQEVVARGRLPRHGQDAFLRFEVEIGPLPGKLLEDGSMDFRERRMFVGVRANELLARKVPATPGEAGCDVLGRPAPARPGRDLQVKVANDAAYDPQTGEVRALKAGVLSLVQESSIKVCSMQVISGDVDYTTGNIDSRDSVAVSGSIANGFQVRAVGDVEVKGNLNGGTIVSGGNVVVHGGIIGTDSSVEVTGDLNLKFIEHGVVHAEGSVVLRRESYYGRLHAQGDIVCEPSSRVLGGVLIAAGRVVAGQIGSNTAEPALIAAAVDPELYIEQQHFLQQLEEKEADWKQLQRRLGNDPSTPSALRLVKEMNRLRNRLADTSLIPLSLRGLQADALKQLTIDIHGTIFASTVLRIGDVTQALTLDASHKRFRLAPDGHSLTVTPL